mmetsp:Transcript_7988/g.33614  ORF Transcript_7988/g.33614 Transcript_7988/m.33614 type:complete len:310 (-) Transcript_7988:236-1165(-)
MGQAGNVGVREEEVVCLASVLVRSVENVASQRQLATQMVQEVPHQRPRCMLVRVLDDGLILLEHCSQYFHSDAPLPCIVVCTLNRPLYDGELDLGMPSATRNVGVEHVHDLMLLDLGALETDGDVVNGPRDVIGRGIIPMDLEAEADLRHPGRVWLVEDGMEQLDASRLAGEREEEVLVGQQGNGAQCRTLARQLLLCNDKADLLASLLVDHIHAHERGLPQHLADVCVLRPDDGHLSRLGRPAEHLERGEGLVVRACQLCLRILVELPKEASLLVPCLPDRQRLPIFQQHCPLASCRLLQSAAPIERP